MASPEFKKLLKFLESPPSDVPPTIEMRRALMDKWGDALPPAARMTFESIRIGDIHAEWTRVPDAPSDRLLLYFHGGGFGMGSVRNYRDLISRLCAASRATALAMDYRLAPEHPFPAGLEDCVSVYRWLLASGGDATRIVFVGDSAGSAFLINHAEPALRGSGVASCWCVHLAFCRPNPEWPVAHDECAAGPNRAQIKRRR